MRAVPVALASVAAMVFAAGGVATQSPVGAAPAEDYAVTDDGAYTRHDGGTDQAIAHCGNAASDPAPDDAADDGDVDSNDGGNRRQGNEPTVAIDPTNPDVMAAGWNDYCQTDLAAGWMGIGFSTDGGDSWIDSTIPGYPLDDSAEGSASPLKGRTDAGDPLVAFDNDGRLFSGGIAFNRALPQNGSVFVSPTARTQVRPGQAVNCPRTTCGPGSSGSPACRPWPASSRTSRCWRSIAARPALTRTTSTSAGPSSRAGRSKIYFSRSTDHGRLFQRGQIVSEARPGLRHRGRARW